MRLLEKGFELYFAGELDKAEKIAKRIVDRNPENARAWFLLALVARAKGENALALDSVNKAVTLQEDLLEAWILRGKILRDMGELNEALDSFNKALHISLATDDYEDPEILIEKARTLLMLGNRDKALSIVNKVLDLVPEDEDALSLLEEIKRWGKK